MAGEFQHTQSSLGKGRAEIAEVEALAAAAWSSDAYEDFDGWRLRFNSGVTRRANSVWLRANDGFLPLDQKISVVERAYQRRGLPALYQVGPLAEPAEIDVELERRGYARTHPTCTQMASVPSVLAAAHFHQQFHVTVTEDFDELWFHTYCEAEQVSQHEAEGRRRILQRCPVLAAYALTFADQQPVATGWGVVADGWLGVFSVATRAEYRRRGAASSVLHSLAAWGHRHGASRVYLQVLEDNAPARALYTRLGFETLNCYHYRLQPGWPPL